MYIGGKILGVLRRNLSHSDGDSQLLIQFPDVIQVTHLEPLFQENSRICQEQPNDIDQMWLFPQAVPEGPTSWSDSALGKRKYQDLQELPDTGSETQMPVWSIR